MKELEKLKLKIAGRWCLKVIECTKGDDYIIHEPDEFLAELNALLEKQKEIDMKFAKWWGNFCTEVGKEIIQHNNADVPEEILGMTDINQIYDYWLKNVNDEQE